MPIDRSEQAKETQVPSMVPVDYITAKRITFLPVWWKLVLISLASASLLFVWGVVSKYTRNIEAVWEGECKVVQMVKKESHLELNMTCNGKRARVFDADVLLAYVNDHKNPRCFADNEDNLYCEPSDRRRMK